MLLSPGPDGEALRIEDEQWSDPFDEPLSEENRRFIEKAGKWSVFDVSGELPFSRFIGEKVLSVAAMIIESGKVIGIRIEMRHGWLEAIVQGDELVVHVGQ